MESGNYLIYLTNGPMYGSGTRFLVKIKKKIMEINLNFHTKNVAQWFIYHCFLYRDYLLTLPWTGTGYLTLCSKIIQIR